MILRSFCVQNELKIMRTISAALFLIEFLLEMELFCIYTPTAPGSDLSRHDIPTI